MKRLAIITVIAAAAMAIVPAALAAAADFSGKWIQYRSIITMEGDETVDVNYDDEEVPVEGRAYVEFKDEKVLLSLDGEEVEELDCKNAGGGKLIVSVPEVMKENGVASIELVLEGNDLVFYLEQKGEMPGTVKNFYKRK